MGLRNVWEDDPTRMLQPWPEERRGPLGQAPCLSRGHGGNIMFGV